MTSTTLLLDNPPSISAAELHEILLTTHASGNAARVRFIHALRALHESRLYMQLVNCPGCLRSAVETGDGRVEVSSEVMDRIEGSAERVVYAAADTTRSVREDLRRIAREPRARCVEVRTDSGCPDQSGPPDSSPNGDAAGDALAALIQLGSPMAEARRLRDTAWARLLQTGESVQAIDADRLLREALRMG